MNETCKYYFVLFLIVCIVACRKPYEPSVIKANNKFLVFEGVINTASNAATTITLSRTRNLYDTLPFDPERSAKASIEAEGGSTYNLQERGDGVYSSANLNLSPAGRYRLKITTADGNQYLSDFVSAKQTPPIDSITWEQGTDGVDIFVNAHDPQNNTRYYRWQYEETWEYHSFYESFLGFKNGQVYYLDSTEYRGKCWSNASSTEVFISSTTKLTDDVISRVSLTSIPRHTERILVKYSILVKQYALTKEAFEHWQIMEKNKRQRGTIFDGQPAQLTENIVCITNPQEPVIGWVSASSVAEKRIFIRNSEVAPWGSGPLGVSCTVVLVDPSTAATYLNDPDNSPAYYVTGGGLAISKKRCVDCTLNGDGKPVRPSFWQ
jgi:Domain of unknown function (DUF4249)